MTIVSSNGSTPQRVGAKMLVYADGRTVGTIGGGCYENDAFGRAREAIASQTPRDRPYELNDDFAQETGLVCGGQMEVFIEPVEASPEVFIFGAGHVGYCAARLAHDVGFRVHVVDDREKFANAERFGPSIDVVVDDIPTWLAGAALPATAYAVIVTRGHRHDLDALRALTAPPTALSGAHRQQGQGQAHLRRAGRGRAAQRPAGHRSRTHWPRHRRHHPAGNRGQHRGGADRRKARQGRESRRRSREHAMGRSAALYWIRRAKLLITNGFSRTRRSGPAAARRPRTGVHREGRSCVFARPGRRERPGCVAGDREEHGGPARRGWLRAPAPHLRRTCADRPGLPRVRGRAARGPATRRARPPMSRRGSCSRQGDRPCSTTCWPTCRTWSRAPRARWALRWRSTTAPCCTASSSCR